MLLVGVELESSVIDNVFDALSFFLFPFVDVFRNNKPCIIVFRSLLTNSFKSTSHLLACLPVSLCVLVDMMSPAFHSAASLVHLSWLCVAIRRAWHHFNFLCVWTQSVVLYVRIFRQLLSCFLKYSIQSSESSSCLHHHRMKYCCLGRVHRVCCLFLEYPCIFRRQECLFLFFDFRIFILSG